MWGDVDCSLSQEQESNSLDLERHSKMFRNSCRNSDLFSPLDLDMWDTRSRFAAQTSAWSGMAAVSGTGFLSRVSTSTSGSTSGFRRSDPGLRKWQSLSHLVPEGPTGSFASSSGRLRAAQGASSFEKAGVQQWLQDAHEHLDTQLDQLMTRNSQLSEAVRALGQEKEAADLPQFEKNRQHGELHEKVQRLEKDLLQMRSSLDRGSNDRPADRTNDPLGRTLPMSQDVLNRQERQKIDTEVSKLREALRDAEGRAKRQEEERNQALQKFQTSAETQRELLHQIEEMNQSINHMRQNYSAVQEQLSEANNKISQACLEKAILSTQVIKLEDKLKELRTKLYGKDHLIQDKADSQQRGQVLGPQLGVCGEIIQTNTESLSNELDQETVVMKEESAALREVNEKLACELETTKQKLSTTQFQLQEKTAERIIESKQITDLEAERSQLIREKEELRKINEGQYDELTVMKERCCNLRESVEVLELEKLKLQDRCLCLEAEVLEKAKKLHLQEEEHRRQDAVRVHSTDELKAVVKHWTEKWQKVALTLQSTQEELEQLKKKTRNELQAETADVTNEIDKLKKEGQKDKEEIENLLQQKANMETVLTRTKAELDDCKRELELERSRSLIHKYKDEGGEASVQTQDKETLTDLSQSSLLRETPADSPQERSSLESRKAEKDGKNLVQLKISALDFKVSEAGQDDGGQANVSTTKSLKTQLEESNRRMNQLQQEKTLALQKLQVLRQLHQQKDEKPFAEGGRDKTICPVNVDVEQQRRMITEQLKSLFKEREGAAASSLQERTTACKPVRSVMDRRSWQQSSGLMPVFEEDEESADWSGGEEGKPAEEADTEGKTHNPNKQISSMSAEIGDLKTNNLNLLKATLRCQQPVQDCPAAAAEEDKSSAEVPDLLVSHCSDETDLQQKTATFLCPDGIFLAEPVNLCSPDEDEDEGGVN